MKRIIVKEGSKTRYYRSNSEHGVYEESGEPMPSSVELSGHDSTSNVNKTKVSFIKTIKRRFTIRTSKKHPSRSRSKTEECTTHQSIPQQQEDDASSHGLGYCDSLRPRVCVGNGTSNFDCTKDVDNHKENTEDNDKWNNNAGDLDSTWTLPGTENNTQHTDDAIDDIPKHSSSRETQDNNGINHTEDQSLAITQPLSGTDLDTCGTFDDHSPTLHEQLYVLSKKHWYWGPLTSIEADDILNDRPDGSFLVRDSYHGCYLISLSFRSYGMTYHIRFQYYNGMFSLRCGYYNQSIVDLIETYMQDCRDGDFFYTSGYIAVNLTNPVSHFTDVPSLQYLCRFVIREFSRLDHIQQLPLPRRIKEYLAENRI
uniref:Uncharacterized protein LOC102804947 n=1 Tax=Saccoglossus kowalevskii TaxID=10224 RepID=A0ABM0LV19_SACKO|nr:PREDICTED: uncharacterized protein LOC102804947 [Saccoglossus kowalevskii]